MLMVLFDDLADAEAQQILDYALYNTVHTCPNTTSWAIPRERIDSKWDYPAYSLQDYTGFQIEEYDPSKYPITETAYYLMNDADYLVDDSGNYLTGPN